MAPRNVERKITTLITRFLSLSHFKLIHITFYIKTPIILTYPTNSSYKVLNVICNKEEDNETSEVFILKSQRTSFEHKCST